MQWLYFGIANLTLLILFITVSVTFHFTIALTLLLLIPGLALVNGAVFWGFRLGTTVNPASRGKRPAIWFTLSALMLILAAWEISSGERSSGASALVCFAVLVFAGIKSMKKGPPTSDPGQGQVGS